MTLRRLPESTCVGAFIVRSSEVLLCRRSGHARSFAGFWDVPGGHVESGETERAAVVRELREELGITPVSMVEHAIVTSETLGRFASFVVTAWDGLPRVANGEHDELRWCSVEDVSSARWLIAPGLRALLLDSLREGARRGAQSPPTAGGEG